MSLSPRVIIVVPTYNERASLPELIERIHSLHIPNCEIYIVDDNSPDGTGMLADDLTNTHPVSVIHRAKKEGLGKAYLHAFKTMLALPPEKQPDYIIQMDADLSHDPADCVRMLEAVSATDVVVGSRYVKGGSVKNWNALRRLISYFGNRYAATVLSLPYTDLTSGLKCFRFTALQAIDLTSVSSVGYNFQIEMTYLFHKKGLRIREIPITFTERKTGSSKFSLGIILESFLRVLGLRFKVHAGGKS